MSNQKPDGWCAWHPSEGWSHMIYRSPMDRSKFGPSYDTKWETKPICLIDPQELSRLRAIEEAVKPFVNIVKHSVGRIPVEKLSLSDWHELCKAAKAIPAPEDKEGKV